jgi:chemotaxis protein methyltransferase CheR
MKSAGNPGGVLSPSTPERDREFGYTRSNFNELRALIYAHAGIRLNDSKYEMVYSRLTRRLRALGLSDFGSYLALLHTGDHPEWENFVNALTTNLTAFFREPHHFPVLADYLRGLPHGSGATLWSAAASTGEEAYSMAMVACETYGTLRPPVRIVASDLDSQVLQRASEGIYAKELVQDLLPERLRRFFLNGTGSREGYVKVRPELRTLVTFTRHNLRDDHWELRESFDCIFCRNVMIYFDKPTQYEVLARMARVLKPQGLLFAGHSESYFHATDLFRPCGRTVYRHA